MFVISTAASAATYIGEGVSAGGSNQEPVGIATSSTGVIETYVSLNNFSNELDLNPVNNPEVFNESILFSFWDGSTFHQASANFGTVTKSTRELMTGPFGGAASIGLPPLASRHSGTDPFTWRIDVASLDVLPTLNQTVRDIGGFWNQIGLGAKYCPDGDCKKGKNTSEHLQTERSVSPMPVPASVWLFGAALMGFIFLSRRTTI